MFDEDPIEIEGPTSEMRRHSGDADAPRTGSSDSALTAVGTAALLALALAFFGLEVSGMAGGGIAGLLLLWPAVALVVLVVAGVRGKWLTAGRAGVHLAAFAVAATAVQLVGASQLERAKVAGDVIAVALNRHLEATGRYPDRLEDLLPRYIREVPRPERRVFAQETCE